MNNQRSSTISPRLSRNFPPFPVATLIHSFHRAKLKIPKKLPEVVATCQIPSFGPAESLAENRTRVSSANTRHTTLVTDEGLEIWKNSDSKSGIIRTRNLEKFGLEIRNNADSESGTNRIRNPEKFGFSRLNSVVGRIFVLFSW